MYRCRIAYKAGTLPTQCNEIFWTTEDLESNEVALYTRIDQAQTPRNGRREADVQRRKKSGSLSPFLPAKSAVSCLGPMFLLLLEISLVFFLKFAAPAWFAVQLFDRFLPTASFMIRPILPIALSGIALCSKVRAAVRAVTDRQRAAARGAELPPNINGWAPGNLDIISKVVGKVKDRPNKIPNLQI